MKALCISLALVILAMLSVAGWAAHAYKLQPVVVGSDYMLLEDKQAKECTDGGGCAIFSEREFNAALVHALRNYCGRKT